MIKKILQSALFVGIAIMVGVVVVHAGSLTPPGSPSATMYTLSDIYTKLINNTNADSHSLSTSTSPAGSFHTLTEIYGAVPTIDPTKVLSGTTYLGVPGSAIVSVGNAGAGDVLTGKTFSTSTASNVSGTIPVKVGEVTSVTSATSTNKLLLTVPNGYYDGSVTLSTTSTAFDITNIKFGINLFGLIGTLLPSGGTATPADVASGKTFFGATQTDWSLQTGTFSCPAQVSLSQGYPGSGWVPGSGVATITESACNNASDTNWKWFNDANGDGDTTDPEDGVCVRTATVTSDSWNGAEQMNAYSVADTVATGGATSTVTSGASWTANRYAGEIVKIISGTASGCWGIVKSNTTGGTITVFSSWLQGNYTACASAPDATSHFQVFDDNKYDNSWIGDYSCTGNFPTGSVVLGSYPSSGTIAVAVADCYDGKRDILPNETDRAILSSTITATSTNVITDSALTAGMVDINAWLGQKVLITSGTGTDSYGIIESNTASSFTVGSWSGAGPDVGSGYKIIYLIPRTSYVGGTGMSKIIDGGATDDVKQSSGPLNTEILKGWKGTRLPTSMDFMGFCGYKDGGSNYENTSNTLSASKAYGNYGGQVGRIDEFMDLANSNSWEWLSEPNYSYTARVAGSYACSSITSSYVYNGYRFRAVLRP